MLDLVVASLVLFHAGAVALTARAWAQVRTGRADFATLRDLCALTDRRDMRRRFGAPDGRGRYAVDRRSLAAHRRLPGRILGCLPSHVLFLLAAAAQLLLGATTPTGQALVVAALGHATVVSATALGIALLAPDAIIAPRG